MLALVSAACAAAFAADWQSPLRVALSLAFLLFVPGLAIADLLGVTDHLERLAIATGASLALETLVAVALIYAGVFSGGLALGIVVGVTLVAAAGGVLRARSRPRTSSAVSSARA